MPTLDDLQAALLSLEGEAPPTHELLGKPAVTHQAGRLRTGGSWLPAAAAAVVIVLAAGGLHELSARRDQPHSAVGAAAGPGQPLPFRLTGALPQLTLLNTKSETDPSTASGTAVTAEYGMEVVIQASAVSSITPSTTATPVMVNGAAGWIDTSCGIQPAPRPGGTVINSTCSLTYVSGPWHVAIFVAGSGGGSQKVTPQQFLEIGDRLELASSAIDSSTWFNSHTFLQH